MRIHRTYKCAITGARGLVFYFPSDVFQPFTWIAPFPGQMRQSTPMGLCRSCRAHELTCRTRVACLLLAFSAQTVTRERPAPEGTAEARVAPRSRPV
jgi:hypothetical protein